MPDYVTASEGYTSASDLFGRFRLIKKEGVPLNERSTIIKYFCDTFNLLPARLAPKLAHLDLPMLYALQSQVKDRIHRDGKVRGRRYFYWAIQIETCK